MMYAPSATNSGIDATVAKSVVVSLLSIIETEKTFWGQNEKF